MKDVHLKTVTFIVDNDDLHGHYYYDSLHDSDYGNIHVVKELTLPKAIKRMTDLGINPIKNVKIFIQVYYFS
jgi:hypothetical protein